MRQTTTLETGNNDPTINMREINYINSTFIDSLSEQYNLSIHLSVDGLLFCITDCKQNILVIKNILLRGYADFKRIFADEILFTYKYNTVNILISNFDKLLIPEEYFDIKNIKYYVSCSIDCNENEIIIYDKIETMQAYMIYKTDAEIYRTLTSIPCKQCNIHSMLAKLISHIADKDIANRYTTDTYVNIYNDYFDILIFKDKSIALCNYFKYTDKTDIVYHVANCIKQTDVNSKANLHIYGKSTDSEFICGYLKSYVATYDINNTWNNKDIVLKKQEISEINNLINLESVLK